MPAETFGKFKVQKSTETIDQSIDAQVVLFRIVLRDGAGRAIKILSPVPLGWKPGDMVHVAIRPFDPDAVERVGE